MNINSNNSEMQLDYTLKDINIDSEVPKINISTKNNIDMQTKTDIKFNISNIVKIKPILEDLEIIPSTEEQNFKSEKDGFDNVTVKAIESNILNIKPSEEEQNFTGLFDAVNVEKIPEEYIIPEGNIDITENGTHNVSGYKNANVDVQPTLQDKSVTPTKSKQTVNADSNYDGLNSVTVNAIPSQYIVPSGDLEITENGTYDVTDKATATVNIVDGNEVYY